MADKKDKKKGKDAHAAPAAEGAPVVEGAEGTVVEGEAPKKKGPPIKLILMIVLPLLLIGGIVGGLFATGVLGGSKEPKQDEAAADGKTDEKGKKKDKDSDKKDEKKGDKKDGKEEKDKGKDKEKDKDKKKGEGKEGEATGPVYFDMQDILVNLDARQGRKATLLKLGITLEIDSAEDKKTLEGLLPRIMDQFQTFLRELRVEDLKGSAGIYRLRQELLARIRPAVEPIEIKDVLFREFLIQ